jgi:hypothetical protein
MRLLLSGGKVTLTAGDSSSEGRSAAMKMFAGLDVGFKRTSVCVVAGIDRSRDWIDDVGGDRQLIARRQHRPAEAHNVNRRVERFRRMRDGQLLFLYSDGRLNCPAHWVR